MLSGCWCLGLYPSLTAVCFSSFAVGNYTQAIECAKTYLLFFPNDEVMHQNLAYYTAMLGEEEASSISPREVRDWLLAEPNQKDWQEEDRARQALSAYSSTCFTVNDIRNCYH